MFLPISRTLKKREKQKYTKGCGRSLKPSLYSLNLLIWVSLGMRWGWGMGACA